MRRVVGLGLFALCLPGAWQSGLIASEAADQDVLWSYELRFMFWGVRAGEDRVSGQVEPVDDFLMRRARILFKLRPYDPVSLSFQFGHDNAGSKTSTEDDGLRIKDAYLNYRAAEGFQVVVGQFKVPFLRHNLESGFNQLLVDRAQLAGVRPAKEGSRDLGVMLWGNRGGFQYRAAGFDGSDQEDGNDSSSIRGSARVSYNWFEHESGLGYTGTTLGQKRILQVGAQIDIQNDRLDPKDGAGFDTLPRDYRAWAADVFYDEPFGGGWSLTLEGAYVERRDDYLDPATDERCIEGFFAQSGFLLPGKVGPGRLQLNVRYEDFDTERGAAETNQENRSIGISYLAKGHSLKIQFDYTDAREEPTELDNNLYRLSIVAKY